MAEIIGLGCTHYPGLLQPDERLPGGFRHLLTAPNVPAQYKDRANWPAELLAELGNDDGVSSARRYGARMAEGFRAVRKALDEFDPDVVLIWGDDQYENFREDIIPAFCVFGLDAEFGLKPWHNGNGGKPNRWGVGLEVNHALKSSTLIFELPEVGGHLNLVTRSVNLLNQEVSVQLCRRWAKKQGIQR